MLHRLLSINEIRNIERAALANTPPFALMYKAGLATATRAAQLVTSPHARILVLAGPGNNGGDAFEAACQLAQRDFAVTILRETTQTNAITDTRHPIHRARTTNARFIDIRQSAATLALPWDLVIDGLFGIGLQRPLQDEIATVVNAVNHMSCPILAIDVPSGIDADTGTIVGGKTGIAIKATHTITFIADKPGLYTCDGVDHSGLVTVDTLDSNTPSTLAARTTLNTEACFADAFAPRPGNSHKGSFGDLIIIGGAQGMTGAPILAARAGLHAGAGRTFVAFAGPAPDYDAQHPELMFRAAATIAFDGAVLVAGPGLGTAPDAQQLMPRLLNASNTLVLDADALNLIAQDAALQHLLYARSCPAVITPHPLEAARLLQCKTADIQNNRIAAARELARRFNVTALVKGAGTVIATSEHTTFINNTGNPALATGGTGDVLAGLCGALLAQHIPTDKAALAAVWIHGKAADNLVTRGTGPIGLTASELIPELRNIINTLAHTSHTLTA